MPRHTETGPALPEASDLSIRGVSFAGLGLLVLLVLILGGQWLFFSWQSSGPTIGFARPDPAADLARFEAGEQKKLTALGWIDQQRGIARIPVSDAMTIIAQRGKLPSWPAASSRDCAYLEGAVPRSPAAINCSMGWGQWLGDRS